MKIYDNLSLKFINLKDFKTVIKKLKNHEVNLFLTEDYLSLHGPHAMKEMELFLQNKKINLIAEVGINIGIALALIELKVKNISVSESLDKDLTIKIKSMAKKQGIQFLITEKFKKFYNDTNFLRVFLK